VSKSVCVEGFVSKRWLFVPFAVGVFFCASAVPVHGQTICSAPWYCSWYSFDSGCVPTPPVGVYNCQYNGPWAQVCQYVPASCFYPGPPRKCCPTCGGCGNAGGAPISLVDGNTYIVEADVKIPGISGGLSLSRTWNSEWPTDQTSFLVGLFGPNWRSTYEERIFIGSDHYIKYSRSDGDFWSFAYAGSAYSPVSPGNATATVTLDSNNTHWTLTFQNGEQRVFNYTSGSLTSITDRNGNTTQITYDSLNRLVTVADPAGRHLYFAYANNSSRLVTSVTSDVGISLSYSYDSQGRLTQVTKPDLTTLSFTYDSNSLITAVKDTAGKILEAHTYDSQGRGLTSSRANGVEGITVTYPSQ
jgi:YD repeat-containing protein